MRRSLIALALAVPLILPQPALFDSFWDLIAAVWAESSVDEGCGADPSGLCAPAPQLDVDEGCGADPDGLCAPAPQVDEGCGADPNGGAGCFS